MKILITTDTYEPMINGVVESVKNLKRELSMRGHDVRILALSDDLHSKVIGDVYYIKSFDIYVYPKARGTIPIERYCRKMIEKWKPDIIHSQTEFFTLTVAKRIAFDLDIPIIHTYHTMYEYYTEYLFKTDKVGKSAAKFLTKHALAYVDAVIAPTEKVKEVLEKYKIHQPISVIPTGIDLSGFKNTKNVDFSKINSLKNKYKITDKEKVMITVGRIGAEKNLDEILDNLTVFTQTHKDFVWLIVGDGPYLPTLKSRVLRLNLEKYVKFTSVAVTYRYSKRIRRIIRLGCLFKIEYQFDHAFNLRFWRRPITAYALFNLQRSIFIYFSSGIFCSQKYNAARLRYHYCSLAILVKK